MMTIFLLMVKLKAFADLIYSDKYYSDVELLGIVCHLDEALKSVQDDFLKQLTNLNQVLPTPVDSDLGFTGIGTKYFYIMQVTNSFKLFFEFYSRNPQAYGDLVNAIQDIRNFIKELHVYLKKGN